MRCEGEAGRAGGLSGAARDVELLAGLAADAVEVGQCIDRAPPCLADGLGHVGHWENHHVGLHLIPDQMTFGGHVYQPAFAGDPRYFCSDQIGFCDKYQYSENVHRRAKPCNHLHLDRQIRSCS